MKKICSVLIFVIWAFLRFYLIGEIRHDLSSRFAFTNENLILFNHGLILLEAILIGLLYLCIRKNFKESFKLSISKKSFYFGLISGALIFLTIIPLAYYFGMKLTLKVSFPSLIGNFYSNAGEEFIYRGVLFAAGYAVFKKVGFGILISSFAFAIGHWDLPIPFQIYIGLVGIALSYVCRKTQGLFAPYVAHVVADFLADIFIH